MLWKIWAAVGAIVCGIGVAATQGNGIPAQARVILGVALVAAIGATVALRSGHRQRRSARSSNADRTLSGAPSRDVGGIDDPDDLIETLSGLISEADIRWLRTETFGAPWRDTRVAPLREVAGTSARVYAVPDHSLKEAFARLIAAASSFVDVYDALTVADPIMLDGTWRMIGLPTVNGEPDMSAEAAANAAQTRLRQAANEICASYEAIRGRALESAPR